MSSSLTDVLAFINDLLQAVIVIFGTAVVLYNVGRARRDRVTRSFCALISFVIITYFAETLVSQALVPVSAEILLRLEWVGIAMVPAAQFHLSDALLVTTGAISHRRRLLVRAGYISGLVFLGLVLFTDYIVTTSADLLVSETRHLDAGPFFAVFVIYFWAVTVASIYNVWRARHRCLTRTTRQRMTTTLLVFLAAPLAVFPYLILSSNAPQGELPIWLWLVVIFGNIVVGTMFAIMTAHLIYFGAASPDRVVRVKLFKFMARVPLAASIVLVVYVVVQRISPGIGIPVETAVAVAIVATVMLVEWAIHAYKRPLERFFHLNNDPDVQRIQQLGERLLTTSDLHQFLESILAATCEALRTPTSFVVALTAAGPQIESVIGPLTDSETLLQHDSDSWQQLTHSNGEDTTDLHMVDGFIVWQEYWLRPLHSRHRDDLLGILGIRARAAAPDLTDQEWHILDNLEDQIAAALEDRILQQEVFAAVEGLLPQIIALQQRRSEATFGGLPVFTAVTPGDTVVDDPEFNSMVRDALRDYWGGPKLTKSPLMRLQIVQQAMEEHDGNATKALRAILNDAIELQKPVGERNLTTGEWILYNILELKFVQGQRVRDVARRLAMSESDLYRKQRVAIENVASTISELEKAALSEPVAPPEELLSEPDPAFSGSVIGNP
ncbi:MAG TPA: hypothetical protein PLD25_00600 [Chloroflexota bacterium]|nr:hypothetical protein [Chloroflexota bacterium]